MRRPSLIRRLIARATGRPRLLGALTAGVLGVIAVIIAMSVNGVPFQTRHTLYVLLPADAPPVDVADQVRVGGQRAGIVSAATPADGHSELTLRVEPRFWPLPSGTTARVRVKPASGLVYVELVPRGAGALAEGARLGAGRVTAGTTLPEAAEAFDETTRGALSDSIRTGGTALLGQDETLRRMGADAETLLAQGAPLVDALTPAPGALGEMLAGTQQVARALAGDGLLPDALAASADAAGQLADAAPELGAAIDAAPGLERRLHATAPRVDRLLDRTQILIAQLDPLTADLTAQLPDARRLLASSRSLRTATTGLAAAADKALADAPEAFRALRGPTTLTGPATAAITPIGDVLSAYRSDLLAGVHGLEAVTAKRYAEGATAPGNPALRFAPVFACHPDRNPYPAPGQAIKDKAKRGAC